MKFRKYLSAIILVLLLCSCSPNEQGKPKLNLIQETDHGKFYSSNKDQDTQEVIQELSSNFETHYERLTGMFNFTPSKKTSIHIYTDREQFYKVMGRETEGTYDAKDNIIKVFTPPPSQLSDPAVHSEYMFQLTHEFVHAIIQQINPSVGNIKWLDEGTAYYASLQLESELSERDGSFLIPVLEQMKSPTWFDDFGSSAYFYSGLIIKFIVDEYGMESLNEIIRNPLEFEKILGISMDDLYVEWRSSLE